MAKFCRKCGAKLDEATGLCPKCDAGQWKQQSPKPELVEPPTLKRSTPPEPKKPASKKEARRQWKADEKASKKARNKEKRAAMTTGQKARRFFLRIIATLLVVSILVVGIIGALGHFGVVDIPIINSILANLDIAKKGAHLNSLDADETYFIVNQEATVKFTVNADGATESVNLCTQDNKVIHKMNDDGLNGDDVANDGIYTYILTTKSIQATSMTYYAVADGCASNEVSIFFFEPLTAETATEAENLFKDTQEALVRIEKKYKDNSGYISSDSIPNIMSEAKQYLDALFSDGKILVLEYDDESIYIKFASGLTLVYEPTIEGVSSGGSNISLTFSAYQPNPDIFAQGISDLTDAFANNLSSVSFTYHADEVTLSQIKSLPANQVILWNGHGGYGPIVKSYLASGEYFDWSAWWLDTTGYYWDCVQDRIIMRSTEEQKNLACFTSKFVDHYCGDLSNDLIILASCHSGQNSKLADAFLKKGAMAVLGFTDRVYTGYCQNITVYTLSYMTYINESTDTYYTLSEALARAQSELGDNDEEFALKYPEVFTEIKSETASPIIFGGENAENYSFSVQIENSRLSEDDIPSGAEEFNGHYYYLYNLDTVTTWAQAKEYCESQGGYLATITSQEEDEFLYSYITDMGYDSVLFGLSDTDQDNVWTWVTGEPFSYKNWASGEPNHQGGYEHYGMYYEKNKDGTWNDGSGKNCPFLCEWGEYQAVESSYDDYNLAQSSSQQQLHDTLIKYISGDLNVRELPQHDSKLVGKIDDFYTKLYFYGETKEGVGSDGEKHTWYKIRSDSNINGWVRSDFVISQDANVMYPYASDNEGADCWKYTDRVLDVRSEPTYNSKLVGEVTDCNTYIHCCYTGLGLVKGVDSDGQLYEWTKVVVNSELQGWVRNDLLVEVSSPAWVDDIFIKNSTVPLNVRAQPQHDSELITSIENADTKMYYWGVSEWGLGSDGIMHEWYQVDVSSTERGWVRSDLIKSVLY